MTSTPTRPVDNVVITKGIQDRNMHVLDGTTVENKGKLRISIVHTSFRTDEKEYLQAQTVLQSHGIDCGLVHLNKLPTV